MRKVLWDLGAGTVRDVLDHPLAGGRDWAYTTAQTLLARLIEKGFVSREKDGRAFRFRPTVSRDELVGARLDDLATRVCDGRSMPLLLNLVHSASFSPAEIDRFRTLLDELDQPDAATAEPKEDEPC
ncbi:MAG: BlaI/MecI/CopY family transcriptional regulator [Planctomycetota bacterium]|nr:BlaI/MecI/CopY family transcriptional regulator [Planctomycetota bacterium]